MQKLNKLPISNKANAGDCLILYKEQYIWVNSEIIYKAHKAGLEKYQEKLEELMEINHDRL
ncbi:MAG: hypothetical protein ACTSVV_10710 [Promethearchaeota archaeon]